MQIAKFFSALCLCALACLCGIRAAAQELPEHFRSIQTEHFYVHFPRTMEDFGRYVAAVCEEAHTRLSLALEWVPKTKTHIVVTAFSDAANGWALGLPYNLIHVYAYAPEAQGELGDYDDWVRQLVYHEYVHTLHADTILGPHRVLNTIFGKFAANNAALPRWYAEGLAVVYETRFSNAGRLRSTLYRTMLRNAALNNAIPSLSVLSNGPEDWPGGTGAYLFGAFFIEYLAKTYGFASLNTFHREYGSQLIPYGINRMALRVWGKDWEELYEEWRTLATEQAKMEQAQIAARAPITAQSPINIAPHRHHSPKFIPLHPHEISFVRIDGQSAPRIVRYHLETHEEEDLVECYGVCDHAWSADAKTLYFLDSANYRNKMVSSEIFSLDVRTGKVEQITHNAHVKSFTLQSKSAIIFVSQNGPRIALERMELEDARTELLDEAPFVEPIDDIVYSRGYVYASRMFSQTHSRDLARFEMQTKTWERITQDKAMDLSPFAGEDGDVYFISDRTGVYNLYKFEEMGTVSCMSNSETGVLNPDYDASSQRFVFETYTHTGTSIQTLSTSDLQQTPAQASSRENRYVYPALAEISNETEHYAFWRWLWPRSWLPSFSYSEASGPILGLDLSSSDPAQVHALSFAMAGTLTAFYHHYQLSYRYTGLTWDLGLSLSYLGAPSTFFDGFGYGLYKEGQWLASFVASTVVFHRHTMHYFSLAYKLKHYTILERMHWELDPDSALPRVPEGGFFNSLWFSWTMSSARRFERSHTRAGGYILDIGLGARAPWLGSQDYAVLATAQARAYFSMPYLHSHKVALRAALAGSWSQTQRPNFVLNSNTALDINSIIAPASAPVLRGYPAGIMQGKHYVFANAEYRFEIAEPEWAYSTLPLQLRRISAAVFSDWAYAWSTDADFTHSKLALGAELWLDWQLGYRLLQRMRIGYAWGASPLGGHHVYVLFGEEF